MAGSRQIPGPRMGPAGMGQVVSRNEGQRGLELRELVVRQAAASGLKFRTGRPLQANPCWWPVGCVEGREAAEGGPRAMDCGAEGKSKQMKATSREWGKAVQKRPAVTAKL